MWFPSSVEAAARFPADVFDEAYETLEDAGFLDLPQGEAEDSYLHRHGRAEQLLEQLMLIWSRLREDRLRQVDWHRRSEELRARRQEEGVHLYSTVNDPEFAAIAQEGFAIETAVWVDYKSFFLFGELLLGEYASFSERAWDPPPSVVHTDGITKFWRSVEQASYEPESTFGVCMAAVLDPIKALDHSLGFYRDKFIVHLPLEMSPGGGGALADPLIFEMSYARRTQAAEAELRRLASDIVEVAEREGLDLGATGDPRFTLRRLSRLLPRLRDPRSIKTVQELLREWGAVSPAALPTARLLAQTLETWAATLIERVGLMEA